MQILLGASYTGLVHLVQNFEGFSIFMKQDAEFGVKTFEVCVIYGASTQLNASSQTLCAFIF